MKRLLRYTVVLLLPLLFWGCPHHIVNQAEDLIPPKNYRPQYLTSRTTLQDALKELDSIAATEGFAKSDSFSLNDSSFTSTGKSLKDIKTITQQTTDSTDSLLQQQSPNKQLPRLPTTSTVQTADSSITVQQQPDSIASPEATMPPPLLSVDIHSIDDAAYPDSIRLRAHVFDRKGRYISGLAPPYFQGTGSYRDYWRVLYDSCRNENSAITDFSVKEVRDDGSEPFAVAFVLDHSPSMGNNRAKRLQEAIRRALGIIKEGDYISVLKFTSKMYMEVALTNMPEEYRSKFKVDSLSGYSGGTAVFSACLTAAKEVQKAPASHKKAIILFTDGSDNSSTVSVDSVMRYCKEQGIRIFPVSYGITDEEKLQDLAQYSGGKLYRIYSVKEFGLVFTDIYRSLRNYYLISYAPKECNGLHTVRLPLFLPSIGYRTPPAVGKYDKSILNAMTPIGSITFLPLEFETGKADIKPASAPLLEDIILAMQDNPSLKIEIRGHTDDVGSRDFNKKLSEQRANSVMKALLRRGIAPTRLRAVGFGMERPLVPNSSDENRARNRRTEFIILER